jgi:hypothetical protein
VGAALDGSSSSAAAGDVELAAPASAFSPSWVHKAEKIRSEMGILKERLSKLKE